jgi:hypothetical protein
MFSIFSFPMSSDFYAIREDLQPVVDLALRLTGSGDSNSSFVKERIRWPWPDQKAQARPSILTSLIQEAGNGCPRPLNTLQLHPNATVSAILLLCAELQQMGVR